jgi:hypothetical protein
MFRFASVSYCLFISAFRFLKYFGFFISMLLISYILYSLFSSCFHDFFLSFYLYFLATLVSFLSFCLSISAPACHGSRFSHVPMTDANQPKGVSRIAGNTVRLVGATARKLVENINIRS